MEQENNSFDTGVTRALDAVRRKCSDGQKTDRHIFPFDECYDANELRDEDIYVYYDCLGNLSFTWQPPEGDFYKVELGGLLDMEGEPFMFSVSWKLDYSQYSRAKYAREHSFGMDCIEPISRAGKSYWTVRGDMTLPVKVTEKPLNWYNTDLTAEEFRKELHRRLRDAKETFLRKYEILRWKFHAKQVEVRRSLTVEECLNDGLYDGRIDITGGVCLPNRHELSVTRIDDSLAVASDDETETAYLLDLASARRGDSAVAFVLPPGSTERLIGALGEQ